MVLDTKFLFSDSLVLALHSENERVSCSLGEQRTLFWPFLFLSAVKADVEYLNLRRTATTSDAAKTSLPRREREALPPSFYDIVMFCKHGV